MTKSRFEALEKRCQKLKKAKIMKIILFFVIVAFLTFTLFYFSYQSDQEPRPMTEPSTQIESIGKEEIANNTTVITNTDKKNYDTLILSPAIKEVSTTK